MNTPRIALTSTLLALAGMVFSSAATAGPNRGRDDDDHPIVGLWDTNYVSDYSGPSFHTHEQWHGDGLEFEVNSVGPGAVCQGTWKGVGKRGVKLLHVGFAFFAPDGPAIPFEETQELAVAANGKSYDGTFHTVYHTPDGDVEDKGTVHAEKLTVDGGCPHH